MRLPNGFGSAYKLSGKRRRPWMARVTVGWSPDGKQLYKIIGYFEEKKDALDALALSRFNPVSNKADITLKELYEEWSTGKYEYISRQTADCYRAAWNQILKYKNVKFKELRTSHIQSIIDKNYKEGKSRSSLKNIKIVAGMLYGYAIQNDVVNKNYAEFLTLPKAEKVAKEPFSELEIQKLEKAVNIPWVDTILILIYTGLRINELLYLTRFSVNLDEQIITGGLKTDAGKERVIPIHPKILKHIKKWYDKNGNYLICKEDGSRLSDKKYREECYYPVLEQLGIRKLTPHACRHTCATLLAKAGADTLSIQRILGHAKYSFTADTYTKTDLDELKKAISLL